MHLRSLARRCWRRLVALLRRPGHSLEGCRLAIVMVPADDHGVPHEDADGASVVGVVRFDNGSYELDWGGGVLPLSADWLPEIRSADAVAREVLGDIDYWLEVPLLDLPPHHEGAKDTGLVWPD